MEFQLKEFERKNKMLEQYKKDMGKKIETLENETEETQLQTYIKENEALKFDNEKLSTKLSIYQGKVTTLIEQFKEEQKKNDELRG